MRTNLLSETLEIMAKNGKSPRDVDFVTHSGSRWLKETPPPQVGSWDDFEAVANFNYDNGFGGEEVVLTLTIVFTDGSWLERSEYDGFERWEFKRTPARPKNPVRLTNLREGTV